MTAVHRKPVYSRRPCYRTEKPLLFLIAGRWCCMSCDATGLGDCFVSAYADWSIGAALYRMTRGRAV